MIVAMASLLIGALSSFLVTVLLLRLALLWQRVRAGEQLDFFIWKMTEWLVSPIRYVLPNFGQLYISILLASWLVLYLEAVLISLLYLGSLEAFLGIQVVLPLLAVIQLLSSMLRLLFILLIVSVVLSWVNPFAPIARTLSLVVAPFLQPIQRRLPTIGGIDLSPWILLLLLQILLVPIQGWLPVWL